MVKYRPNNKNIVKKFACKFKGCGFEGDYLSVLGRHQLTHSKPYSCGSCQYRCSRLEHLTLHERIHNETKPYVCDFDDCEYKTTNSSNLIKHKRIHTGSKPYICTYDKCDYRSSDSNGLKRHVRRHTGEKTYFCSWGTCRSKFPTLDSLKRHNRKHTGLRPYICNFEGCDYRSSQSSNMKVHQKVHSIEGQIRQKKQENRVNKILKEWGHTVDCEIIINASRNGCVEDSGRHFSRIDFSIINCVNAMLILEVDEDQHYWYNLSCEFSRMSDIRAALVKAGYELPIYWIRYNPQGKYHVNSEQVKTYRPQREIELKKHIEELCSPDFVPKNQVNIHYMYYDLISETKGPEVMLDKDFPDALKNCVTWCV